MSLPRDGIYQRPCWRAWALRAMFEHAAATGCAICDEHLTDERDLMGGGAWRAMLRELAGGDSDLRQPYDSPGQEVA